MPAQDKRGQPEAFRQVAARLPLIIDILRRAEKMAAADKTTLETSKKLLESCKLKAEEVRHIFEKVARTDSESWYIRYRKAIVSLQEENTIEYLIEGILTDIRLFANGRELRALEDLITEMREMPDSLPLEAESVTQIHSGRGDNIRHTGPGTMNIHKAKGDAYHNVINSTANFGSRK